jgi:hypothetical protein
MNGRRHLRLVEQPRPQAIRRYETRFVVSSARMPIGRSRIFHLSELDISRLVAIAEHLEAQT